MPEPTQTLLICTVGGSEEPLIATLKHWQPARVWFVHTAETKESIEATIVPRAREEGAALNPGQYDLFPLPDSQDLESCVDRLRQLTPQVRAWAARGTDYGVVVDFTGGTKCMSAAIALQASRWPCLFSYVGGTERTKGGVGIVVSGKEKILQKANPWEALGHQAVGDFIVLFDQRALSAASKVAEQARDRVDRPDRKREFAVLASLAKAYDAWDRFDHEGSRRHFGEVLKSANDLCAMLGSVRGEQVLDAIRQHATWLEELCAAGAPSLRHVLDLLANAKRRREEERFDDGLARIYRAIEATAQAALKERHGFESTEIPLGRLPESLRLKWEPRANEGVIPLGLQNAYALLAALEDPLGKKFLEAGLSGAKSPLVARNRSLLAHGFERISRKDFDQLWTAALRLAEADEKSLPVFPTLADGAEP